MKFKITYQRPITSDEKISEIAEDIQQRFGITPIGVSYNEEKPNPKMSFLYNSKLDKYRLVQQKLYDDGYLKLYLGW